MPPLLPGELLPEPGEIVLNAGRPVTTLLVANSGDRPVQVGSHFHFHEANSALKFDRDAARGLRDHRPRSLGLDTGCVYGGALTGYLLEADRLIRVSARAAHRAVRPSRPHLGWRG